MSFADVPIQATQPVAGDAPSSEPDGEVAQQIQGRSTWQLAWARLRRDKAAVASAIVIVLIILFAIFAPLVASITGHGPNQQFRIIGCTAPITTFNPAYYNCPGA